MAEFSQEADRLLQPFSDKYGEKEVESREKLRSTLIPKVRSGAFGLLRDLDSLFVMSSAGHVSLTIVMQSAKALRDDELLAVCTSLNEQSLRQQSWLEDQIKHRAPHVLVVPQ